MAELNIYKVNALPASPAATSIYFVKNGAAVDMYVTDSSGNAKAINTSIPTLDNVLQSGYKSTRALHITDDSNYDNYIDQDGMFANGSDMLFYPSSTITTNASVVGLLTKRNSGLGGISAAVAGIDNSTSGTSESWGGYFNSLRVSGKLLSNSAVIVNTKRLSVSTYYCDEDDYFITTPTVVSNVYLPSSPETGRVIIIKNNGDQIGIYGNGESIIDMNNGVQTSLALPGGDGSTFYFDGTYWQQLNSN